MIYWQLRIYSFLSSWRRAILLTKFLATYSPLPCVLNGRPPSLVITAWLALSRQQHNGPSMKYIHTGGRGNAKTDITRWYSSNGPAARLLRWLVLVLCLVTYGPVVTLVTSVTCIHVQMSKYLHNTILFPQKSQFMVIHFYQEDTFHGK